MIAIIIKNKTIIMNGNNAGILIVYLHVDAGNAKREDFYFLRILPFFINEKIHLDRFDFRGLYFRHNGVYVVGILPQW
jgi:hypothetical protein